jgi:hypothetical protein
MVRIAFGLALAAVLSFGTSARAAPPIEAYGRLPAVDFMRLSPSGDKLAYIATESEAEHITVVGTDLKPITTGQLGDVAVRDVQWAGDDHVMVFTSATMHLDPGFPVWRVQEQAVGVINVLTGNMIQVFGKDHEDKVQNAVFGLDGVGEIDGHWYGWFGANTCTTHAGSCDNHQGWLDLYRVDLDIEQNENMARALHGAGKPVELIELDGENYLLSHQKTRIQTLKAAVAFVEKYNPPN